MHKITNEMQVLCMLPTNKLIEIDDEGDDDDRNDDVTMRRSIQLLCFLIYSLAFCFRSLTDF